MKDKITAFMHVEIVHHDPYAAAEFLREVFGAEQVEKEYSARIEERFGNPLIHMRMGNVIFQILKPLEVFETWHEQLKTSGPGIHNISLAMNDIESVREAMLAKGCKVTKSIPIERKIGNAETDGPISVHIIDAFEQAGLRFELVPMEGGYEPPPM